MACYHPSEVAVKPKGSSASVLNSVTVPCGHCLGCRADQARQWAVRIIHESYCRESAWFCTLTYDEENLPENGSLAPEDLRLFHRSMRKRFKDYSYYAVGEYGEETDRPHYHAVLFGPHFLDRDLHAVRRGARVFTSSGLASAWPHGLHEFTGVTYANARYTAGYIRKKLSKLRDPDAYLRVNPLTGELVEIQQEFSRVSTRPAIGRTFIERYWREVYPADYVVMDGHPMKPPRYYDKWMDTDHSDSPRPCPGGCNEHRETMIEVREQRWQDIEHLSDEKLIMKEKIHRAKVRLFQPRDAI